MSGHHNPIRQSCFTCHFYKGDEGQGLCRRHPPKAFIIPKTGVQTSGAQLEVRGFQVPTDASGWCGEFELTNGKASESH